MIGKRKHCIHCLDAHSGTHADYVSLLKLNIEVLQAEVELTEQLWQDSLERNTRLAWTPPKRMVARLALGENVWSAALWIEKQLNNLEKAITRSVRREWWP